MDHTQTTLLQAGGPPMST